jgi:hypothetical protein
MITIKRNLLIIERKLVIREGMFDKPVSNLDEEEMFDFELVNNFFIGNVVIMEPLEEIRLSEVEDKVNVIRFIPNEEIKQIYADEYE